MKKEYRQKSLDELSRVSIDQYKEMEKAPIALILDNIRSMQNVGSIFRSADAFGIDQIILMGITPRPPHRDIHKTALGAEQSVNWNYAENIEEAKKFLPDEYRLVALEQTTSSEDLHRYQPHPIYHAIVVGNEVTGVSPEVLKSVDLSLEIMQKGTKHSLNVSNSASIALYHLSQIVEL